MSQYNDQCAAIRESLTKAGYNGVNVNTVVASQGQYNVLSNRWGNKLKISGSHKYTNANENQIKYAFVEA